MSWENHQKYLKDNNITGSCYYLNLSNKQVIRGIIDIPRPYNKLQPIGICLTDKKQYCLLTCPMSWEIQFITDDKDYFIKNTEDNWSGEKGKIYDLNCWQVLQEIQQSYGYQSKCLLRMKIDELQKIIEDS